jgi:hypothetical protein
MVSSAGSPVCCQGNSPSRQGVSTNVKTMPYVANRARGDILTATDSVVH